PLPPSSFTVSTHVHPSLFPSFPTRRSSDLVAWPASRSSWPSPGSSRLPRRSATDAIGLPRRTPKHRPQADGLEGPDPEQIGVEGDRKSTRLNSSHGSISYAVFCLKKKKETR